MIRFSCGKSIFCGNTVPIYPFTTLGAVNCKLKVSLYLAFTNFIASTHIYTQSIDNIQNEYNFNNIKMLIALYTYVINNTIEEEN